MLTATHKRTHVLLLILVTVCLKITMARWLELGNAEAYYWVLSNQWQWGYFDHPPMVAWWIRIFTAGHPGHEEVWVRAGAILSGAVSTWLIYDIGRLIKSETAGWFSALLYTASGYSSFASGLFMLPDAPLMLFWLLAVRSAVKLFCSPLSGRDLYQPWFFFGLWAGLALISKYQAIFLWSGMGLFLLTKEGKRWRGRGMALALLVTILVALPVFSWEFTHRFEGFQFHAARIQPTSGWQWRLFFRQLLAMVMLINPFVVFLLLRWIPQKSGAQTARRRPIALWLCLVALPLLTAFGLLSFFREALPHWPGPGFVTLCILLAITWTGKETRNPGRFPTALSLGLILLVFIGTTQLIVTTGFPGPLIPSASDLEMGSADPTLDMFGWRQMSNGLEKVFRNDYAAGRSDRRTPLLCPNWSTAAHVEFYLTTGADHPVKAFGPLDSLHEYYWLNHRSAALVPGDNAYFILPSDLFDYHLLTALSHSFRSYHLEQNIPVLRSGVLCKQIYIFYCAHYDTTAGKTGVRGSRSLSIRR